MDCLFCKIANGDIPSEFVYKDEKVAAFKDINPVAPEHILIIPCKHISTINDLEADDTELVGHMVQVAKQIAAEKQVSEEGYRLVFNVNRAAGQAVFHIHLHLLAGRDMQWPPG